MYHFKQAVCIPGKKGGKDSKGCCLPDEPNMSYKLGDKCEVPKEVSEHHYFQSLMKDGKIVELADKPAPKPAAKPAPKPEAKPKDEPKPKK